MGAKTAFGGRRGTGRDMKNLTELFADAEKKCRARLLETDMTSKSDIMGVRTDGNSLDIPLYGISYRVSAQGVKDSSGNRANPAVGLLLLTYVLNFPDVLPPAGDWITFREFKGAGVLSGHFAQNTNKIIETSFSGRVKQLRDSSLKLGGTPSDDFSAFDLAMHFKALPRVPVFLRFNDADGPYPAQCSILFRRSAEIFLDIESIGIAGTLLTGSLIRGCAPD